MMPCCCGGQDRDVPDARYGLCQTCETSVAEIASMAVWRLASSRTLRRFERSSAGARRGQVDDELLRRVCAAYGWDAAGADLDDRLRERGLLRDDDELTVAGALVLTDPAQTLNASKLVVEIRWYGGAGPDPRRRMTIGVHCQSR